MIHPISYKESSAFEALHTQAKTMAPLSELLHDKKRINWRCSTAHRTLTMDYRLQAIDDKALNGLQQIATDGQIMSLLAALEDGQPVNSIPNLACENRRVSHVAERSQPVNVGKNLQAYAQQAADCRQKICRWIPNAHARFDSMIWIGTGGSYTGPMALIEALGHQQKWPKKIHTLSGLDQQQISNLCDTLDLDRTVVVVASKSGGTLETRLNHIAVRQIYQANNLTNNEHFVAITTPGSALDNNDYAQVFRFDEGVGGRYCITSAIGLVLLAWQYGVGAIEDYLQGARELDANARLPDIRQNLALLSALLGLWNYNFRQTSARAIVPYIGGMKRWIEFMQQLEMESNGKSLVLPAASTVTRTSPPVFGGVGPEAQHSFFQWLHQAPEICDVEFIGLKPSSVAPNSLDSRRDCSLVAQAAALATGEHNGNANQSFAGNRPSSILWLKNMSPRTLGALAAYAEYRTIFYGWLLGLNPFDQEGVTLGKRIGDSVYQAKHTTAMAEPDSLTSLALSLLETK